MTHLPRPLLHTSGRTVTEIERWEPCFRLPAAGLLGECQLYCNVRHPPPSHQLHFLVADQVALSSKPAYTAVPFIAVGLSIVPL